jgi:hypothetical protein
MPPTDNGRNVREASVMPQLIAEIDRAINLLAQTIQEEQVATGISDQADHRYSLSARAMSARHANLLKTRAALVDRLHHFGARPQQQPEAAERQINPLALTGSR